LQRKWNDLDATVASYAMFRGFLNAVDAVDNACANR
jgi:hypothetical protein